MNENKKFAQVGRFIYEFQRVRATLAGLYEMLEPGPTADMALDDLVARTTAAFAQRRAADVVAVAGLSAVLEAVQKFGARLDRLLTRVDLDDVPGDAEMETLLTCQHELERYQRLAAAS
jgi:hypothetical protein